jgi:hypothetical protein
MAFFCADDPSAFRVPVAQSAPPELVLPVAPGEAVLSSLPHAVRRSAPATTAVARRE